MSRDLPKSIKRNAVSRRLTDQPISSLFGKKTRKIAVLRNTMAPSTSTGEHKRPQMWAGHYDRCPLALLVRRTQRHNPRRLASTVTVKPDIEWIKRSAYHQFSPFCRGGWPLLITAALFYPFTRTGDKTKGGSQISLNALCQSLATHRAQSSLQTTAEVVAHHFGSVRRSSEAMTNIRPYLDDGTRQVAARCKLPLRPRICQLVWVIGEQVAFGVGYFHEYSPA